VEEDGVFRVGVRDSSGPALIRALRAPVHGFVDLELPGGFGLPEDIDDSFTKTIDPVIEAISAQSLSAPDPQLGGRF